MLEILSFIVHSLAQASYDERTMLVAEVAFKRAAAPRTPAQLHKLVYDPPKPESAHVVYEAITAESAAYKKEAASSCWTSLPRLGRRSVQPERVWQVALEPGQDAIAFAVQVAGLQARRPR